MHDVFQPTGSRRPNSVSPVMMFRGQLIVFKLTEIWRRLFEILYARVANWRRRIKMQTNFCRWWFENSKQWKKRSYCAIFAL